jgi:hypothetical protein
MLLPLHLYACARAVTISEPYFSAANYTSTECK